MADHSHRIGRAVAAALGGGVLGVVVVGPLAGEAASALGITEWGALGWALIGALVGAAVFAGLAQLVAFSDEAAPRRRTTAVVTTVATLAIFGVAWPLLAPLDADVLSPQLILVLAVIAAAVLSRLLAGRRSHPDPPTP